jgi:hypothetical protein
MDIEKVVNRILWGKSIVDVKDRTGKLHTFILRSLTIKENNLASYLYDKEYADAIATGILTCEQLKSIYESEEVWTEKEELELRGYPIAIKRLKTSIKDHEFFTLRKKQLEKRLRKTEKEYNDKIAEKDLLFAVSAEQRAQEVSRRFMVMMSTETLDEQKYWVDKGQFLAERDLPLIYNLALAYYKHNLLGQTTIRKIARSPIWQYRFAAYKRGADLFGRPVSEWSEMQGLLIYWSQIYDSVYNHPDRPSDFIINDDNALDGWLDSQSKESNRNAGSSGQEREPFKNVIKRKQNTGKRIMHSEKFVMVQHGDKDSIRRVQDKNDPVTRARLQKESETIKKKGRVSEFDLRKGQIRSELQSLKRKG